MANRTGRTKSFPPLTSEEALIKGRELRRITILNKTRSKNMERDVAKILGGRRIPMSGAAAAFKGDVEVLFKNNPGKYIVECKMSAQLNDKANTPQIRINFEWLTKLRIEVEQMNAKFGVLIVHFKGHSNDYVFIRREDIQLLIERYQKTYLLPLITLAGMDVRTNMKGITRRGYSANKKMLDTHLHNPLKAIKFILPDTEYIIMYLQDFREIVEDL